MHILCTSRTLPFHSIGGMQVIAWDLMREFVRLGHQVTVITTAIAGHDVPFVNQGVSVIPLSGTKSEVQNANWWRLSLVKAVEVNNNAPVDMVLSVSASGAALLGFKRDNKIPFVFQAHGTSWGEIQSKFSSGKLKQILSSVKNFYWLFKDATIYDRCDRIVLVGDTLKKQFARPPVSWIAGRTPLSLIRNGVDFNFFRYNNKQRDVVRKQLNIPSESNVLCFAARLHPQKGGKEALGIFKAYLALCPDSFLLVVGDGEQRAEMESLTRAHGLAERVRFLGSVSRDQVSACLSASDAFVFPTLRKEGLPMNVLEALASGLKVFCSESTRDVFEDGIGVEYIDPFAPIDSARAIEGALSVDSASICDVRPSLLPERYSLEYCAKQYIALIQGAV